MKSKSIDDILNACEKSISSESEFCVKVSDTRVCKYDQTTVCDTRNAIRLLDSSDWAALGGYFCGSFCIVIIIAALIVPSATDLPVGWMALISLVLAVALTLLSKSKRCNKIKFEELGTKIDSIGYDKFPYQQCWTTFSGEES